LQLAGTVTIVTGGASGLGAATARHFAAAGASVAVWDLDRGRGPALADEIGGLFVACDVASHDSVEQALEAVADWRGPARVVVCCAGVAGGKRLIGGRKPHDLEVFEQVVRVNLTGTFNVLRLAVFEMQHLEPVDADGERGVLITTSSIAAYDGVDGGVAYSASKAGVAGMTLPLARDLAGWGIRAVSIAPGSFATPMVDGMPEPFVRQMEDETPFPGRFGDPDEFAALAAHIATNPMLNGTTIRLDGGLRMRAGRLR
jgi:NAD(P)-dependent dehydrogenase (short-subunit alcohol dehydrogenase family)